MKTTLYDMIVIGAGSAGLTYAIGAVGIGAKVLLIEKHIIGGDCTHYGCIPSKALIHLAKEAHILNKYECSSSKLNLKEAQKKVKEIVDSVYAHETPEKIKKLGVYVEIGSAKFVDQNTINVNNKEYTAKKIIIATGSSARQLEIDGIDNRNIMTNKDIFKFTGKSIAIIGAGPIGAELSQALNRLGCKVYLINNSDQILIREDKDAAKHVESILEKEGVELFNNSTISKGVEIGKEFELFIKKGNNETSIKVEGILASIGRVPNIKGMGLEEIGLDINNRGVVISRSTQTMIPHIFAVGDVAGTFQFTHYANHMAKVALAKSIFKAPSKIVEDTPRITFTRPEIASIGSMEIGENDLLFRKDFDKIDRAICEEENGFFKIVTDKKGIIKGATIVGSNSSELINEIAVMIAKKIPISDVSNVIHPYPSYGYGLRNLFDEYRARGYTENKKKWVQWIFGLRGGNK